MTPVRSRGSTNGCLHASEALRSVLAAAGVRGGRGVGVAAEHKAERLVCNYYGDAPTEVARPPHTLRNTPRALATTASFAQPNVSPWPAFLTAYRLPPSTYRAAQPPDPQQPHTLIRHARRPDNARRDASAKKHLFGCSGTYQNRYAFVR